MALAKGGLPELGDLEAIDDADRAVVAGYNRDDCVSTWQLRDWLETRRDELVAAGTDVPRPEAPEGVPSEKLSEWQEQINALIAQLTGDVQPDPADRTPEQHARWLLAHSLDWHRREQKALWWEYFRLSDLTAEDLLEERAGLSGLTFIGVTGGTAKAPIHRYSFPPQETEMRGGEDLHNLGGAKFGSVEAISLEERWVDIKKRMDTAGLHSDAVFAHKVVRAEVLAEALVRIGTYVAANGIEGDGPYRAARDLLMGMPPRIGDQPIQLDGEPTLDAALRIAPFLQPGVFPIQGPPDAGKTHTGARMICALFQAGKTVGVTANSHKVIRNLLNAVVTAADEMGVDVQCMQKPADKEDDVHRLRFTTKAPELLGAIGDGVHVGGGTAWLWASPDAAEAVDVLFVDEAGQMSLANVLAVSQARSTVVLLGDPQQLDQPHAGQPSRRHRRLSAAAHPRRRADRSPTSRAVSGRDVAAPPGHLRAYLGAVLRGASGVAARAGAAGDGRASRSAARALVRPGRARGQPELVAEEVERVATGHRDRLAWARPGSTSTAIEAPITRDDILIVAPYNAQVVAAAGAAPDARIGTVDKFQGQEAPIVIYSMATSSADERPRGMEFLYSLNRLNVATSRARCALRDGRIARRSSKRSAGRPGRCSWRMRSVGIWNGQP